MPLRLATIHDLKMLKYWDSKPHVQEATGDDGGFDWEYELPRAVAWREFLIFEVANRPIGFIQIIDPQLEETHYWGDCEPNLRALDIWIGEEDDIGRGFGTAMMNEALVRCFAVKTVTAVVIDPLASNTLAIKFYARLGFKPVDRRTFGTDDCLVMRLNRVEF